MGILRIHGILDVGQFWPNGAVGQLKGSDADTIKVVVNKGGVTFNGQSTSFLDDAYVIDHGKNKRPINGKSEATIRLQGVDAPELHFPTTVARAAAAVANGDFRQLWAETATKSLAFFLKKFKGGKLVCEVVSQNIHKPKDVCDSHGRIVGNVLVRGVDINLWLLDQGLAFPTFYHSMLYDEIAEAMARARRAQKNSRGVWRDYAKVAFFDPKMTYRRFATSSDKGPVLLPKLFRRCSMSYVTHGSLSKLMGDIRLLPKDRCVPTHDFLKGNSTFKQWGDPKAGLVRQTRSGKVELGAWPWDFVFKEEPSTLNRGSGSARKQVTTF